MATRHLLHTLVLLLAIATVSKCDEGYFWHVTDFHWDWSYEGELYSCKSCCMPENPGPMGDFMCDSPWILVNSSIHAMKTIKQDVDFLIWTGDSILHHYGPEVTYALNDMVLDNITAMLTESFPGKSVYATFGNHDYVPSDQFPGHNDRLYNDTLDSWRHWINDPSQDENVRKGGYYTVKTEHGLRIVAMNTNLHYKANKVVVNDTDPADHLSWLRQTLHTAELKKEKVLLTSHVPIGIHAPRGKKWIVNRYNAHLLQILERYAHLLVGMHFGHEHVEGFRVLKNNQSVPTTTAFCAPSVTPYYNLAGHHNPAVRLIKYDRLTGKQLEIDQYYLNLNEANRDIYREWEHEYNSKVDFGLQDLTGKSMWELVQKMENPLSQEFRKYWRYVTVSQESTLDRECDAECHAAIMCGFEHFELDPYYKCIDRRMKAIEISLAPTFCYSATLIWLMGALYYML